MLAASVLAIPLWLIGIYWVETHGSGWSTVARYYPAGNRALTGSLGTAIVTLIHPGGVDYVFRHNRGHNRAFIEVGFDAEGFWLRSTRHAPAPAIFVPWKDVTSCGFLHIRTRHLPTGLAINDQKLNDACTEQLRER
ncbi:MAG: hypothetical protein Q8J78_00880 [Moraxellaceae bacterium]|nr:hypothetical protein [Moraxellaceae bacterium]